MGEQSGFMNIKGISDYLGIKVSTIYALVEEKRIPHYRIGRQIRFKRSDVDGWMEGQKQEAVDVKTEARRVIGSVKKKSKSDVEKIVDREIDDATKKRHILDNGNQVESSTRKGGDHGLV